MIDEVVLNKVAQIERALARARDEFRADASRLADPTIADAILLNLQRACEASIDLASRVVARRRLGLPQHSRAAFELLETAGLLDPDLTNRMKRMVGFRNIAVHEYQELDISILESILRERLGDFEEFCRAAIRASEETT